MMTTATAPTARNIGPNQNVAIADLRQMRVKLSGRHGVLTRPRRNSWTLIASGVAITAGAGAMQAELSHYLTNGQIRSGALAVRS